MDNVVFAHRQPDSSWSKLAGKAEQLRLAAVRVVRGHGPFTITTSGRAPTSDQTSKPMTRRQLLADLGRELERMAGKDTLRISDRADQAVLVVGAFWKTDPRRFAMASFARWGVRHEPQIHYDQRRPFPLYHERHLPMTLDCSGSTITYAHWADAPDPSGRGFNGTGDTDAILAHLRQRPGPHDLELGDLVLWANGSDGKHVAVVIETGRDPLLASHGFEGGPIAIRFSAEDRYHASETPHFLNLLATR